MLLSMRYACAVVLPALQLSCIVETSAGVDSGYIAKALLEAAMGSVASRASVRTVAGCRAGAEETEGRIAQCRAAV